MLALWDVVYVLRACCHIFVNSGAKVLLQTTRRWHKALVECVFGIEATVSAR